MNEQNLGRGQDDALERTLTALYTQEIPQSFQERWPAAIRQEARAQEQSKQRPGASRQTWRLIMPAFAAVLLAAGIWAVNLPSGQPLTVSDAGLAADSTSGSPMISPMSVLSSTDEAEALDGGIVVQDEALLLAETASPGAERKTFGIAALVAAFVIAGGLVLDRGLSKERKCSISKLHEQNDKGGTQP